MKIEELQKWPKDSEGTKTTEAPEGGAVRVTLADGTTIVAWVSEWGGVDITPPTTPLPTDTAILEWLEANHSLHREVHAVYVVDGYEVSILHDDHHLAGPWHGETLREAYQKGMAVWGNGSWIV